MSITLRPIRADDEPFLYEVYASTRHEELAVVPWSDEQKAAFLRMQFHAQHQYYQQHFSYAQFEIVLRNDQPVGRLYVDRSREEIRIIDIALLADHRRAGIGSWLLGRLIDESNRVNLPLTIHVERFNPALNLYQRLGFTTVSDTGVYFLLQRLPAASAV